VDDGGEPRLPEPAEGRFDVVVVGGGIVGLAVARELSRRRRPAAPAFFGVRAQAVARDGRLLDDFAVSETPRALHVRNAPSPAATSALALARLVADRAESALS